MVGRAADGAPPDVVGRAAVEAADGWRIEEARAVRLAAGAGASDPEMSFSRWRADGAVVMRAKTPDSGRVLLAVPALVVALLAVRVAPLLAAAPAVADDDDDAVPLTGSLLGETLRWLSPVALALIVGAVVAAVAISVLVLGFRSDRARDRPLPDDVDDILFSSFSGDSLQFPSKCTLDTSSSLIPEYLSRSPGLLCCKSLPACRLPQVRCC